MTQQDVGDQSEHRVMLANSVTDFARGVDLKRVRQLRETKAECDRKLWSQMAELGWLGVLVPEEYGGMGLKLADMAIVAQGLARVLLPEPLTAAAVLAARVIGDGANDIPMIQGAGLGVAYHGKPAVAAAAPAQIDHGDLSALLYVQGYKRSEFVISK